MIQGKEMIEGETLGGERVGTPHDRRDRGQVRVGNAGTKDIQLVNLQEEHCLVLSSKPLISSSID
jgi:hypothetical protein